MEEFRLTSTFNFYNTTVGLCANKVVYSILTATATVLNRGYFLAQGDKDFIVVLFAFLLLLQGPALYEFSEDSINHRSPRFQQNHGVSLRQPTGSPL